MLSSAAAAAAKQRLVIVESPAKCAKIQSFLGRNYRVVATMGHIRGLDESLDAVGIDRDWEPMYVNLATKKDAIARLRAAAREADEILLASDDDREGEAIAWHTCAVLGLNPATTPRIVFHEITQPALLAAVAAPRTVDLHKVHAQQARSMLDLLVGFTISRTLWSHVAPKLSAGRCQTPALRLVLDRDTEVASHLATAVWKLEGAAIAPAAAASGDAVPLPFAATDSLETEAAAQAVLEALHAVEPDMTVVEVKQAVSVSAAPKPLITSTLQQEASSLHGLSPKTTMQAAQKLYEAGHITYMRTDNAVLSEEAQESVRAVIAARWGEPYCATVAAAGAAPPATKAARRRAGAAAAATPAPAAAQAAHEAIRPTHPEVEHIAGLDDSAQRTVYALIWRRTLQSRMAPARTDVVTATLRATAHPDTVWTADISRCAFAGWRILERSNPDQIAAEDRTWRTWTPLLQAGAKLQWTLLEANQVFSRPRGRYTEASLIADLEKRGIGRPSTFASIVGTLLDRGYVEKTNADGTQQSTRHLQIVPGQWPPTIATHTHTVGAEKNKLRATALGKAVADYLYKEFADIFAYTFTASMEQQLDDIAQGSGAWKRLLQTTWDAYKERYTAATAGGAKAAAAARTRVLDAATGIKVVLSRRGPLFVQELPPAAAPAPAAEAPAAAGGAGRGRRPKATKATKAARFAPLPPDVSFDTATLADAMRAFASAAASAAGDLLGTHEGKEIRKKKGPYGFYAEMEGIRVPLRGGEPLTQIVERLTAKATAATAEGGGYERKLGEFTIKRGPYGLYFYKHTLKRATFLKFPTSLDPDGVTAEEMPGLYGAGLAAKKRGAGRGGRGGRGGAA